MSTLPFLLSVADELDNINSQSYMDDFGLGFHPHRQYYRSPTIQLSLPASTDWMQERQRCRTHKFVDETQNNLQVAEEGEEEEAEEDGDNATASTSAGSRPSKFKSGLNSNEEENVDNSVQMYNLSKKCKNYHRHTEGAAAPAKEKSGGESSYRLHTKCLEGNNSSSDESLQKVSSSIEFLTCFLIKKSRASKNSSGASGKKS